MKDQLIKLGVNSKRAAEIEPILLELISTYQLPKEALPEFISNVLHESGMFTIKAENMNYSTPARLVAVWPSRFTLTKEPNKRDANLFINKPRELANLVYGGRMGNMQTNDGFDFRGGGFAQITGRDAYTLFTRFVNLRDLSKRTIQEVAQLVQTNDIWAMDSALWFFCEFKNLEQMAIDGKFKELVKRWNGGFIGMKERSDLYNQAEILFT
jgi:putative chitinase